MRWTNYHRLFVGVSLLSTGCLVQGTHNKDTTTVTKTAQIATTITSIPAGANITQTTAPATSVVITELPTSPSPLTSSSLPPPPPTPAVSVTPVTSPGNGNNGEVLFTIAIAQVALANIAVNSGPQGVITIQAASASASPLSAAGLGPPEPTTSLGSAMTGSQSETAADAPRIPGEGPPPGGTVDPAEGGFLGGNPPNSTVDLPLTIVFMIMFIGGAATHISIYRANAKRGHKFLLSDLMFDFCMVRTVTCIFRIIWIFIHPRGIVLAAQIFFNGGAAVIFAVNIFLVQRIVRSMHPKLGWSRGFSIGTRGMAISVPLIIVVQIASIIALFFSVGDETRLNAFEGVLKFGSSYNLFLVTFPFIVISVACAIPGPRPERFGKGSLRVKTSLVMLASILLATGATIRSYAFFNPRLPVNDDVLYGKPIFYTTQFMLEIIVVALYALLRFDLLFHVPNGSSGPGDYSGGKDDDTEKARVLTREDIEDRIAACQIPHQILHASYSKSATATSANQPVYAVFFPQFPDATGLQALAEEQGRLPPRPPARVSRRQSLMEVVDRRSRSGYSHSRNASHASNDDWGLPSHPRALRIGLPIATEASQSGVPLVPPSRPPRTTRSMYQTGFSGGKIPPPGPDFRGRH